MCAKIRDFKLRTSKTKPNSNKTELYQLIPEKIQTLREH